MVGTEKAQALGPLGPCGDGRGGGVPPGRGAVSRFGTGAPALAKVSVRGQGPRATHATVFPDPPRDRTLLRSGPQPSSFYRLQDRGSLGVRGRGPPPRPPPHRAALGSALAASLGDPLPSPAYPQAPWGHSHPPRLYPECLGEGVTHPRDVPLPSANFREALRGPRRQGSHCA